MVRARSISSLVTWGLLPFVLFMGLSPGGTLFRCIHAPAVVLKSCCCPDELKTPPAATAQIDAPDCCTAENITISQAPAESPRIAHDALAAPLIADLPAALKPARLALGRSSPVIDLPDKIGPPILQITRTLLI